MGWTMPWYTISDGFDADFGVDEWHGHNVFFRDGDLRVRPIQLVRAGESFAKDFTSGAIPYATQWAKPLPKPPSASNTVNARLFVPSGGRCCMDINPGEGAPSPSKLKKLRAGGGRSWAVRRATCG